MACKYFHNNEWHTEEELKKIFDSNIIYQLRSVDILSSDKAIQIFAKGKKNNWDLNKILTELKIPKGQKQLILAKDITNREDIITSLLAENTFTVETKVAKRRDLVDPEMELIDKSKEEDPSQYYVNLTVPGGINYTESEVSTPDITPNIKGHAAFSTEQGIGWFRSDDKQGEINEKDIQKLVDEQGATRKQALGTLSSLDFTSGTTKTRRILEVQSDLFQKGRDKKELVSPKTSKERKSFFQKGDTVYDRFETSYTVVSYDEEVESEFMSDENQYEGGSPERLVLRDNLGNNKEITYSLDIERYLKRETPEEEDARKEQEEKNQFLQLLNKKGNWVSFFIQSIIQDSIKKGYEKVVFPTGDTAAKVEGHQTIVNELEDINSEIDFLKNVKIQKIYSAMKNKSTYHIKDNNFITIKNAPTKEFVQQLIDGNLKAAENRKNELKSEGIEKLKPIEAFYSNRVTNILNKLYKVNQVTDEYGNTWNEIDLLDQDIDSTILLSKDSMLNRTPKNQFERTTKGIEFVLQNLVGDINKFRKNYWITKGGGRFATFNPGAYAAKVKRVKAQLENINSNMLNGRVGFSVKRISDSKHQIEVNYPILEEYFDKSISVDRDKIKIGKEATEIASKKHAVSDIKSLAERLAKRINLPIAFTNHNPDWIGAFKNGKAYLNLNSDNINLDTPWHEIIGHPVIEAVYQNNNELFEEFRTKFKTRYKSGQIYEVVNFVKTKYNYSGTVDQLAENDTFMKEFLTTLLSLYTAELEQNKKYPQQLSLFKQAIQYFKDLLKKVSKYAKSFYDSLVEDSDKIIKAQDIPLGSSLRDISYMLSLNNQIDVSDVDYESVSEFSKESIFNKHIGIETARSMPFKYSKDRILNNTKSITVRQNYHKTGIYKLDDKLVRVSLIGASTFQNFLTDRNMTKKDFLEQFLGKDEKVDTSNPDFKSVNNWLKGGDKSLYIYQLKLINEDDLTYEDEDFTSEEDFKDNFLNKFIHEREEQRQRIIKLAKAENKNEIRRNRLFSTANALNNQILLLRKSYNMDSVLEQANNDIDLLNNILKDDSNFEIEDIRQIYNILSGHATLIKNFSQYLSVDPDSEIVKQINSTTARIDKALTDSYNYLVKRTVSIVEDATGRIVELVKDDAGKLSFAPTADIKIFRFTGASVSTNPLVQAAFRMTRIAKSIILTGIKNYEVESNDLFKEFYKATGIKDKEKAFDQFINVTDKGMRLISKYNNKYYSDKFSKARIPDKGLNNTIMKSAVNWFKNNHSFNANQEADKRNLEYHKTFLKRKMNIDDALNKIIDNFINYRDTKLLYKSLATYYGLKKNENVIDYIQNNHKEINRFLATANTQNPFKLVNLLNKGTLTDKELKDVYNLLYVNSNFNIKHKDHAVKWPFEFEVSSEKYLDEKFKEIDNLDDDNIIKRMHSHIRDTFKKYKPLMGDAAGYLPFTAIPEISKKHGVIKEINSLFNLKEKVKDESYEIDPITGDRIDILKINTLGTRIPMEERSLNLENVLKGFVEDALKYSEHKLIHDELITIKTILKDQKIYKLDKKNKPVFKQSKDGKSKILQYEEGLSNNYKLLENHINVTIHEKRRAQGAISKGSLSKKVQKDLDEINARIEEIKEEIKVPYETFITSAKNKRPDHRTELEVETLSLIDDYEYLQSQTVHYTSRRIVNFIASVTRKKLLGFNIMGFPIEFIEGFTRMISMSANPSIYFSFKDLMTSFKSLLTSLNPSSGKNVKETLSFFNINTEDIYGSEVETGALNEKINKAAFFQYELSERGINYMFVESMLRGNKTFIIEDLNGEEHRLFDVMSFKDGKLILPDTFDQFMFFDQEGRPTKLKIDMELLLTTILKQQRKRTETTDPIVLNQSDFGVIMGIFRASWMFEQIYYRFGNYTEYNPTNGKFENVIDPLTGFKHKGYYKSFFSKDLWKEEVVGEIDPVTLEEKKDNYKWNIPMAIRTIGRASILGRAGLIKGDARKDELTEINVRKMMREVSIITMFSVAILTLSLLREGGDEDDDKIKMATLILLENLATRGFRDWSAYLNPSSANSILQNASPIVSVLEDLPKIMITLGQTISGDAYAYEGTSREYLRLPRKVIDAVPFIRQIERTKKKVTETQKLFR